MLYINNVYPLHEKALSFWHAFCVCTREKKVNNESIYINLKYCIDLIEFKMLFIGWWMLKMSFAMTKKKCRALWNRSKRWSKPRRGALKLWTMQMPNWCPLFISFEVSRRPITILCWDHCDQPSSRLMWQSSKRAPAENFCGFKKLCSIMVAPMWLLVMCIGAFVTQCEYYDYYYY